MGFEPRTFGVGIDRYTTALKLRPVLQASDVFRPCRAARRQRRLRRRHLLPLHLPGHGRPEPGRDHRHSHLLRREVEPDAGELDVGLLKNFLLYLPF